MFEQIRKYIASHIHLTDEEQLVVKNCLAT